MLVTLVQGDWGYDLNFTLQDADGNIVDLTDGSLTLQAQSQETPSVQFSGAMAIVDATLGRCKYTVQATDFPQAGVYNIQFVVVFSGTGEQITFSDIQFTVESRVPLVEC